MPRLVPHDTLKERATAPPHTSAVRLLRILHCHGRFCVNQGGAERQARAVCAGLAARGHQVSVVTQRLSGSETAVPGVAVHPRIRVVDRGRLFGITYIASAVMTLVREAGRVDILHAHHLYLDAVAALIAGRVRRKPVVAKMVGTGVGGDVDRLRGMAGGSHLLQMLHGLDAVIAPSHTCRGDLIAAGFPEGRVRMIPNGVNTEVFRPCAVPPVPKVSEQDAGPAVVFTGRLIEAKGLLDLLEAWPLVLRHLPNARLVLVGSGPLESKLRRQAESPPLAGRVHVAGEVDDVRAYLRTASAFVLPSWAEGLSNALLEAMAVGLPCVATDIGPIRDAVTPGEEAILVPVRAPSHLASAICTVLSQPVLASRLGRAARMRAEAEFSLENTVTRLETLYGELCARKDHGGTSG